MTSTMGTYHQATAIAVQTVYDATLESPSGPLEAYTCDLLGVKYCGQLSCITAKDWWQATLADLILKEVIEKLQDRNVAND